MRSRTGSGSQVCVYPDAICRQIWPDMHDMCRQPIVKGNTLCLLLYANAQKAVLIMEKKWFVAQST